MTKDIEQAIEIINKAWNSNEDMSGCWILQRAAEYLLGEDMDFPGLSTSVFQEKH